MDGSYKIVNACSCFAGLLPVETKNRLTCVTQCHLLLFSRKSWLVCCCRPTLLFGLDLLHPTGRRWKGKLTAYCLLFLREREDKWEIEEDILLVVTANWIPSFIHSQSERVSWNVVNVLYTDCWMFLTVSSVSPQISSPSPVWLRSTSSLWLQTAQRPLEVESGMEHELNCLHYLLILSLLLVFLLFFLSGALLNTFYW